jgi:peptide/nickel transport system permease protein
VIQLAGRRLLLLIPTVLIVTFAVFFLIKLVPGDPATFLAGGDHAQPARIAQVRQQLGLNKPFLDQYWHWASHAARLDFGKSLLTGQSVTSDIRSRLPVTLSIVGAALIVGTLLGIPLGVIAGARQDSWVDRALLAVTSAELAVPNFVLAILLVNFFAIKLHWFDAVGFTHLTSGHGLQVGAWLKSLCLPALALGIGVAGHLGRQIRAGVVETLKEPYIRTAWAKGCRPSTVIGKHVVKNAAIPTVTVAGLLIGGLLGGTVIVEQIFGIDGIGSYLVRGVQNADLPVIQGVAVMFVVAFAIINLLADVLYGWLNPRVQVA